MGVSSCRLYINKFLLILFVFAMSSCTSEVISDIDSSILEIKNTYIEYSCESLIVATGGLSIPTLGGSSFGYRLAEDFEVVHAFSSVPFQ